MRSQQEVIVWLCETFGRNKSSSLEMASDIGISSWYGSLSGHGTDAPDPDPGSAVWLIDWLIGRLIPLMHRNVQLICAYKITKKCLGGKTDYTKTKLQKTYIISQHRALKQMKMIHSQIKNLTGYMMCQSSRGWCVTGSQEKKKKRGWVACLLDHPLAVAGHGVGIYAPNWSNKVLVKRSEVSS